MFFSERLAVESTLSLLSSRYYNLRIPSTHCKQELKLYRVWVLTFSKLLCTNHYVFVILNLLKSSSASIESKPAGDVLSFSSFTVAQTKNRTQTWILDLRKNKPLKNKAVWKAGHQGLKTFSFVSCHIKDNAEKILFHIKRRGVQGLVFMQMTLKSVPQIFTLKTAKLVLKQQLSVLSCY